MLQIDEKHKNIIRQILEKHSIEAYVFGSRAKGHAKHLSDLDLCLKKSYTKSLIRKMQNDFEESDLPYKVDVVSWDEMTDAFKAQIEKDLILFS